MNKKEERKKTQNPNINVAAYYSNNNTNTGKKFEEYIYDEIKKDINDKSKVYLYKKYYSLDRQDYITVDIAIEKYVEDKLFGIIIIECKDYKNSLSVDDVEEFHSKLQQIGADNTKGVIVTSNGMFQKSAIRYAISKGISLAFCNGHDDRRNRILYYKKRKLVYLLPLIYIISFIRDHIMIYNYKKFYCKYNFYYVLDRIYHEYN